MRTVSVRELRNAGGSVLDRVSLGESFMVTRDGKPAAELTPLRRHSPPPAELVARRQALAYVDPDALRQDIDAVLDPGL
jgi:prevent-host-death family protein